MTQSLDRIAAAFARAAEQKRAALVPYIAAGNPLPATTVPLMHALVKAGADVVQIYTGLIYRGPALITEVAQALQASGR
jgi:tryptophan synthase alpha chain